MSEYADSSNLTIELERIPVETLGVKLLLKRIRPEEDDDHVQEVLTNWLTRTALRKGYLIVSFAVFAYGPPALKVKKLKLDWTKIVYGDDIPQLGPTIETEMIYPLAAVIRTIKDPGPERRDEVMFKAFGTEKMFVEIPRVMGPEEHKISWRNFHETP